jgi:hypothetical protein
MKAIAGSIVVLGSCVLVAAGTLGDSDRGKYAMGLGTLLALFGVIVTFGGTRDGR